MNKSYHCLCFCATNLVEYNSDFRMSLSLQENLCGRNQSIPYNVYQVKHKLIANFSFDCSLDLTKLPFEHNSSFFTDYLRWT